MGRGNTGSGNSGVVGRGVQRALDETAPLTVTERDEILRQDYKAWSESLTEDERHAVGIYTNTGRDWGPEFNHVYINNHLRRGERLPERMRVEEEAGSFVYYDNARNAWAGGQPSPRGKREVFSDRADAEAWLQRFHGDKDFSRAPAQVVRDLVQATERGRVKRTTVTYRGTIDKEVTNDLRVGDTINYRGMVSSTINKRDAIDYAKSARDSARANPVLLVIEHAPGTKGAYTDTVSGRQKEFLQHAPSVEVTRIVNHPARGRTVFVRSKNETR